MQKKDDIVGCGISTDGQVYFTLNGALIGFATPGLDRCGSACGPSTNVGSSVWTHCLDGDRTKRFFGVVGFEGSIQFETNFGATPFAFDHLSLIPGLPPLFLQMTISWSHLL